MRSTLLWIIAVMLIGSTFYFAVPSELDLKQYFIWEIIAIVILSIVLWFVMQWRRSMRLDKPNITIQLFDE